jgi:hypothetical protein
VEQLGIAGPQVLPLLAIAAVIHNVDLEASPVPGKVM